MRDFKFSRTKRSLNSSETRLFSCVKLAQMRTWRFLYISEPERNIAGSACLRVRGQSSEGQGRPTVKRLKHLTVDIGGAYQGLGAKPPIFPPHLWMCIESKLLKKYEKDSRKHT